ncbi:MAG: cupin domain-containing protein [Ignavibacteria bacterium]
MATKITSPSVIKAVGNKPKIIQEFIGRVNTKDKNVSIARMKSPGGWVEPGQTPGFDEYTIVLKGELHVKTRNEEIVVNEGEAVITKKGEWIQYSTPHRDGAEYIAVCLPAFSPETVNRDE